MGFFRFMNSGAGRVARIVAGAALIAAGIALGGGWLLLAAPGALALLSGAFDFCLPGALFGVPVGGSAARAHCANR